MKRDFQRDLRTLANHLSRAHNWATLAVEYAEQGDPKSAEAARVKVAYWLRQAMAIEKHWKRKSPHESAK